MKRLLLVIVAALMLSSCAAPPPPVEKFPELKALAHQVFDGSGYEGEVFASDVEWTVGPLPPELAGYTQWFLVLGVPLAFTITVSTDYADNLSVIAHEGGHVVCVKRYNDVSEECAENIRYELVGGTFP